MIAGRELDDLFLAAQSRDFCCLPQRRSALKDPGWRLSQFSHRIEKSLHFMSICLEVFMSKWPNLGIAAANPAYSIRKN